MSKHYYGSGSSDEPMFEVPLPEPEPGWEPVGHTIPSRASDPDTSHEAERLIRVTANNQRGKLLAAYRWHPRGLTDDEAQVRAGVSPASCYWKRCSELREVGFIVTTGETRRGRAGVQRMVCALTPTGLRKLAELELESPS